MSLFLLFCIKNITNYKWNNIIDKIMGQCMSKYNIIYILLGKQKEEEVVLGFIQYEKNKFIDMSDTVKTILDSKDVVFWKECDYFNKLGNFASLMYTTVTRKANLIYEQRVQPQLVHPIVILTNAYKMQYYDIDGIFDIASSNTTMVLVIEERLKELSKEFLAACRVRQNKAILSLLTRKQLKMVHIVHPATIQCYHSFDFHHNPHYGIRKTLLPYFKWILLMNDVSYLEYGDCEQYHTNKQITIYNNPVEYKFPFEDIYNTLRTHKLKSRKISNQYISYGYSSEYRSITGEPMLTTGIAHIKHINKILGDTLPTLSALSKNLLKNYPDMSPCTNRRNKYSQRMGSNFNYHLNDVNIYEGLDISIVYSKYGLDPHCDVMNDWRDGYNFITVLKSTFHDDEVDDLVTISLICYTRKAIGDRLNAKSQINYNKY